MNTVTSIARTAISNYLKEFKIIEPPEELANKLPPEPSGVYIRIFRPDGEIRTMGGSVKPTQDNLASEIAHTAVKVAINSDIYEPITKDELKSLKIAVDIIGELTNVTSSYLIDTKFEGVYVEDLNGRHGIIIPNIYNEYSMTQLVNLACNQGKINPQLDHYRIFVFKTKKYQE